MQTNINQFGETLSLPDFWQRKALNLLREEIDVVLHAPTGAGKTFVFEKLIESGWKGKATYTVPTRALANDKFRDWRERGWDVGLVTGDLRYQPNAPVIVATMETQRGNISKGMVPDMLVIDEYQLLADEKRGAGYEVTLAMTPNKVRLLLMSGSVGNPHEVADWLKSHGRKVSLVSESNRPVPLDEVFFEALLKNRFRGPKVRGQWPKLVANALRLGLGPILIFAPRRKAAEDLALQLASELPEVESLDLTSEQRKIAGKELGGILRKRVAYHHSGLDYLKRAGLVEPLAKAGQLQVVVATTGLGAGINFSMRSVLVTDREYRVENNLSMLRPDELLQMFGRAGRRGFDERGFVIVGPKQTRLSDARPAKLKRSESLDWPAMLSVMIEARKKGKDHLKAAKWLARRLFTNEQVNLGFQQFLGRLVAPHEDEFVRETEHLCDSDRDKVIEMRNSIGLWERRGGQSKARLGEALVLEKGEWVRALSLPDTLSKVKVGNPCRFGKRKEAIYGREIPLALTDLENPEGEVRLIKSFRKKLMLAATGKSPKERKKFSKKIWKRKGLESEFKEFFPLVSQGGRLEQFVCRGKILSARLRYEEATILAWRDARGRLLLNPPMRRVKRVYDSPFKENSREDRKDLSRLSPSEAWLELGLIDSEAVPTKRGEIFSFFSRGEGLAIAVALEDSTYPIRELIYDLSNLRAGHRFRSFAITESRLALVCRDAFGLKDCPGYLKEGMPVDYGEGAVEVLRNYKNLLSSEVFDSDFSIGDLERIRIEWRSLLALISHAPELENSRWLELQREATRIIGKHRNEDQLPEIPDLPIRQKRRFESKQGEEAL